MSIIALTGYAESGKSSLADILVYEHGYMRTKFAEPLKTMLRSIGLGDAEIEGDRKAVPCRILQGKTPRHAMQTLGTEWGREMIGDSFWVQLWQDKALTILAGGGKVVVDDCRFANEAAGVLNIGGAIWRIVRPGQIAGAHASESGIDDLPSSTTICNAPIPNWRDALRAAASNLLAA